MTIVRAIPQGIIFKKVGEEMVLLDFERGIYYGLNPVGARIWELFADGKSMDEIVDVLTEEFDVERTDAKKDVEALMDDLVANGLVSAE